MIWAWVLLIQLYMGMGSNDMGVHKQQESSSSIRAVRSRESQPPCSSTGVGVVTGVMIESGEAVPEAQAA